MISRHELGNLLFKPISLLKKADFIKNYLPKYILKLVIDKILKENNNFNVKMTDNLYEIYNQIKILSSIDINIIQFNSNKKIKDELKSYNDNTIDTSDTSEEVYPYNHYEINLNENYEMDKVIEIPYIHLTVILNYNNLNTIVIEKINEIESKII